MHTLRYQLTCTTVLYGKHRLNFQCCCYCFGKKKKKNIDCATQTAISFGPILARMVFKLARCGPDLAQHYVAVWEVLENSKVIWLKMESLQSPVVMCLCMIWERGELWSYSDRPLNSFSGIFLTVCS